MIHFHRIPGKAHGMISGPAEMRLLMGFWAQSLKHRPLPANTEDSSQASFVEVQGGENVLSALHKQG